jgi:hypothetical protein
MTPANTASFCGQLPALKVSTTVLESLKLQNNMHAANRIPAEEESHIHNVWVHFQFSPQAC